MKKTFKIIIPILLVISIIACSAWYLFVYDREFTRDMLLQGARYFEAEGNHTIAQWFYNRAYEQASDNDAVAIELARQYKSSGNYTKAEYTLYNAIKDGGGVSLYVELCRTYVEQDKLYDAVNLLDNVAGETREKLEKLRPSAPVATPASGFYSQYISVSVEAASGTLYVSTEEKYPSVATDAYTGPVALKDGENVVYAIVVGENGLVSTREVFPYTIGGVITEVEFADDAIEAKIREILNVSTDKTLYSNDLWTIETFEVPAEAEDYSDLRHLVYLKELTIHNGKSNQLSNISTMVNLEKVDIQNTSISTEELDIIGTFIKLQKLTLNNCSLSTTSPLNALTKLTYLDLSNNAIRDISAIANMPALEELYLQRNALNDLGTLSSNKQLKKLDVSYNSVPTLAPIFSLTGLTWLNAQTQGKTDADGIQSLSGIEALKNLTYLCVADNNLTDISPVVACINLVELDVSHNNLTDISKLSELTTIMAVNFSHNQVKKLPQWPTACKLVTIDGSHNQLESLDELAGLESLNNVIMDYNENIESVEELAKCHLLVKVSVYGTKVKEIDALTDMSVVVNYDPTQE